MDAGNTGISGGCQTAKLLMDEYVQLVRHVASIRAQIMTALQHEEPTDGLERLVHTAERTKQHAKDAFLTHVQKHGCLLTPLRSSLTD